MSASPTSFGETLRVWRLRRRLSQLDLALEAGISTRHLSFVETGRARPSREMVLHLTERLEVPLRERNAMLTRAGFAAAFPQQPLEAPASAAARAAVLAVLAGHEPFPALAIDRHWQLVAANAAVTPLLTGADPELLRPPLNVLRLSLHPRGLAPRIANLAQWRDHLLTRLQRQIELTCDPVLTALLAELKAFPAPSAGLPPVAIDREVAVPLRLTTPGGTLSFLSTTMVFGTAVEVTLSELAIEAFFPADPFTAAHLRRGAEPD